MTLQTTDSLRLLILKVNKAFSSNVDEDPNENKFDLLKKLFPYFVKDNISETFSSEITSKYYSVLSCLLGSLKPTLFYKKWQEDLFDSFFLIGIHHDSFMILVRQLSNCSPSYEQEKILDLLEKFLQRGNLLNLLLYQCIDTESWNLKFVSTSGVWDELITLLISLPERVANKTKGNMKKIFTTSCFVPLVASSFWKTLQKIHERLLNNEDCNMQFLGKLLGRLCTAGHADTMAEKLSSSLIRFCEGDFVWRRISLNLISKIPSGSLEQFITPLLMHISWYGFVEWLLGDSVISNNKLKFLLTKKLLLIRQFENPKILQNIIGYLAAPGERRSLFNQVLHQLLDIWEDGSLIKHQSYPHQYYLASAIIVCTGHLKPMDKELTKTELMNKVLHGVQIRIGNPEPSIRTLGMVIGENLAPVLDLNAPELKFEYESSPELDKLCELLTPPKRPEAENIDMDLLEDELVKESNNDAPCIECMDESTRNEVASEDLDSDDDLEPYDMSDDIPTPASRRPMYIRDCMLGFIERDKAEWMEACLKSAEALIHSDTDALHEVAEEMAKLLLHLEDTFGITNFVGLRHRALIALTIECPVQVAEYLTSQFYERNYNIRQRLDILEVLAAASQELSHPKYKLPMPQPECSQLGVEESTKQHWKYIVGKRIEAKTKRISKGYSMLVAEPEKNRFNLVAGYFFFPLLEKYDRSGKMLDLFGDDSYVLGRLLHTLGIIMYSASNTVISKQMNISLFEFLKVVRHHPETFVRQSAIFAVCTIFISASPFLLVTDLQDHVVDSRNWLETVVEKDPDFECQVKAARVLSVVRRTVQNALPSLLESVVDT